MSDSDDVDDGRPVRAAGFLIRSAGLFLLGHVTQQKDDDLAKIESDTTSKLWTIPKGCCEQGESVLECAMRELREETGIDLNDARFIALRPTSDATPFFTYTRLRTGHRRKIVDVFFIDDSEGLIRNSGLKLVCESILVNMKAEFANREGAPEIDAFMWADEEKARRLVVKSQIGIFKQYRKHTQDAAGVRD
jgi:8-oxo-dGTP pyrophosphatase MutT (NUDIX family)